MVASRFRVAKRNPQQTNSKVISEIIPQYYVWRDKRKALFFGKKPDFIPRGKIVSKREMRYYQYVQVYKNPIAKALEFQRMMQEKSQNQNQLARRKLGISRVRVHQLLSLLKLCLCLISHSGFFKQFRNKIFMLFRVFHKAYP